MDQQSSDHRRKRKDGAAVAVPEGVNGESSTDHQRDDGGYETETAGVIKEEQVEVVGGEASAPLLAHVYCSDNNDPKPAADDDVAAAAVAESPSQEGEGAGDDDKAAGSYLYAQEVATQVLAARRPPLPLPLPCPPEEGSGGHGGSHN